VGGFRGREVSEAGVLRVRFYKQEVLAAGSFRGWRLQKREVSEAGGL
jgi:hypothetical protein